MLSEKDGSSISVRKYKSVVGEHGKMMTLKYDDYRCWCGRVETEIHVLFECTLYEEERERCREAVGYLKDGMDAYEIIKGYHVRSDEIKKETMRYMRMMWAEA